MRAYWEFAACAFRRGLAYRANVALRVVGGLATVVIQVALWRALLGQQEGAPSAPLPTEPGGRAVGLAEMVTYAILSTCVGMVQLTSVLRAVNERLQTGNIGVDLAKPLSYPLFLASDALGAAAFNVLFTVVPTLAVAAVAFGLAAPASPGALLAFLAAVGLAMAISFALGYLMALGAFWFLTTLHFQWTLMGFTKLLSGAVVPLWFFPPWLASAADGLPFRFLNFVPVAVYLGRVPEGALAGTLLVGLAWAAGLLVVAHLVWSLAVRRLVLQGG